MAARSAKVSVRNHVLANRRKRAAVANKRQIRKGATSAEQAERDVLAGILLNNSCWREASPRSPFQALRSC
jgi:hypothetical protein